MGQHLVTERRSVELPTAPVLRVRMLDGFELSRDGSSVDLPRSAQRVVAFLALHDRPLLRGYVAGQLWPDVPERRAGASLRSALWRLGEAGHAVVEASVASVRLAQETRVDVREVREAARALTDPVGPGGSVPPSAERFAGIVLPDWYDDWVVIVREQLRQICLRALEALAERALVVGDHGRAMEAALGAVGLEPLRESAHRLAARVDLAEGNVGQALRRFEAYRALLDAELGVAPSPEFRQLVSPGDGGVTPP